MPEKFEPARTKERKDNAVISVRLPAGMIAPFYAMCREKNMSPSSLGVQCIQFAFNHLET